MVTPLVVGIPSNRHEVKKLRRVPIMEQLWITANEIPTDEDVKDSADERHFLSEGD
jgi:hypothetical protein